METTTHPRNGTRVGIGAVLFLIGCLLVLRGLSFAVDAPEAEYDGTPSCDGKVMNPGDSCTVLSGPGESGTYEEYVATGQRNAKSNSWVGAEFIGGFGAILMLVGVGVAIHWARLSPRVTAAVTLVTTSLPLLAIAIALWPLQNQTRAASEVPVGVAGLEFPYTAVLAVVVVLLGTAVILVVPHSPEAIERAAQAERERLERQNRQVAAETAQYQRASLDYTQEWRQQQAERQRQAAAERHQMQAYDDAVKAAQTQFEQGGSDDPWGHRRVTPPSDRLGLPVVIQRLNGALGIVALALACILTVEPQPLGTNLPGVAPGLAALASYVCLALRDRTRPYTALSAWRWGVPVVLSGIGAVIELLEGPPATWPALFNATVFLIGLRVLAASFGITMPRAPIAGRLIYTTLGALSLAVGARLAVLATDPTSSGWMTTVAYTLATAVAASGWLALGTALKTESQNTVPTALSLICDTLSVATLVLTIAYMAITGTGALAWIATTIYTLGSLFFLWSRRPRPQTHLTARQPS